MSKEGNAGNFFKPGNIELFAYTLYQIIININWSAIENVAVLQKKKKEKLFFFVLQWWIKGHNLCKSILITKNSDYLLPRLLVTNFALSLCTLRTHVCLQVFKCHKFIYTYLKISKQWTILNPVFLCCIFNCSCLVCTKTDYHVGWRQFYFIAWANCDPFFSSSPGRAWVATPILPNSGGE